MSKIPIGLFLINHDDIIGPVIKTKYFKVNIEISHDFISNIYLIHAGDSDSLLNEFKYKQYRIITYFTGNLARKSQAESIFGIIFKEFEYHDNIGYFLHKNLQKAINSPNEKSFQDLYEIEFQSYYTLLMHLRKISFEGIQSIELLYGTENYIGNLFSMNARNIGDQEKLYTDLLNNEKIKNVEYFPISLENQWIYGLTQKKNKTKKRYYLVVQTTINSSDFIKIIKTLKKAIINNPCNILEMLFLFLAPDQIFILDREMMKKYDMNHMDSLKKITGISLFSLQSELDNDKQYSKTFQKIYQEIQKKKKFLVPITNIMI